MVLADGDELTVAEFPQIAQQVEGFDVRVPAAPNTAGPLIVLLSGDGAAQVIKSGAPSCKAVALTFDLCPVRQGTGYDAALVDYLIEHKIPATFFASGKWPRDRRVN